MITFGLNYDVKQEFVNQFLEVSNNAVNAMQGLKGHINTVLYSNVNKPNSFLIYSEWETNDDFRNFVQSDMFKSVQNMGIEMLENRPRHKVYEAK